MSADPSVVFDRIHSEFLHGNLDLAQQHAHKAEQDFSASGAHWSMKFRLLDAEILTYQGRRPEVLLLLNNTQVYYPVTGDLAIKRYVLCGLAHARLGQPQQADEELQQASDLATASHSSLTGEVLRAQAQVQIYRSHLTEAQELFRSSLKVAREQRNAFLEATDLLNLGLAALKLEHYDESLSLFKEAADFATPIQAGPVTQAALGNMGVAYSALGDYEKALSSFQEAGLAAKSIGTTSAEVDWLWNEGSAYYRLGNLQQAASCYEASLKDAQAINSQEELIGIHTDLGFLFLQQRLLNKAKEQIDQALALARSTGEPGRALEPEFVQALLAMQEPDTQDAEHRLLAVYGKAAESASLRGEVENALANFYASSQQSQQADRWYRKSIHTFEAQRSTVKDVALRLPFFANGDKLYRDYADFLIASQKDQQALRLLDLGRARTLAEALGPAQEGKQGVTEPGVSPQQVARKLNATLLFYSLGAGKSYLWTINAQGAHLFVLPPAAAIEAEVRGYQKAILRSSDPLREANATAQILYKTLVSPATPFIPRDAKVIVIADGVLNELNFETLLTADEKPHYWIEDVTLSNANSIGMLSRLTRAPVDTASQKDHKQLLLIGNPTTKGTGYEALLNAFAEVRNIEQHFPKEDRKVVTQGEAVPASYAQSNPDRFSYIHFVAHGTASRISPLDSAVVLSPPAGAPDQFKLYARDIMRSPLHARLVTISACYGSGLRSYAGEGLVGLSWAFLRAGSHQVIAALWEVNDASTPLLMNRLYSELAAGNNPDVALRAAKLSLIHLPGVYRKPLYWGGFQLFSGS